MTSLTVLAWARAAVVPSTRLVRRRLLLVDGPAGGGLGQFLRGVTDDPDDAAGPPGAVTADEPLGVGPGQGAVALHPAEVRAVVAAAALERLRDHGVEPGRLIGGHAPGEPRRVPVVFVGAQVEHFERGLVHVHEAAVQIPVEAAHSVQGEAEVRVGGPVVRE